MAILRFGQHQSQWSDFQGQKIIYILLILISDFTVSGSGFPMGHGYWKYVSLYWSYSYNMATAPGGREKSQGRNI